VSLDVQILNAAIFLAIGAVGVYYGARLGYKVPWHNGFPFQVFGLRLAHPQYIGSVLTVWGMTLALWSIAPPGQLTLAAYWTLLYCITAIQEEYL
jgi:Phospholipid methyltransferase